MARPKAPRPIGTGPVASPLRSVRVTVRRVSVRVHVAVSRAVRVRMTLRGGRATSARTRRLDAGTAVVDLGRLRAGSYALRLTAGRDAIERRFTVR